VLGFILSLQILHPGNLWDHGQNAEYVILCIGDSWTVGEKTGNYPDELQKALQPLLPSHRVRVINLGRGELIRRRGFVGSLTLFQKYHPAMVIALLGNNDHWNLSESAYWRFIKHDTYKFTLLKAKIRVSLHSLRIYKLGIILYDKLTGLPTPNQFYHDTPENQPSSFEKTAVIDRKVHHEQLEYNLIQLIELAQLNQIQLVFQTYFHFHGYHVNEIIRDVAITYHIPLVDNNLLFHQQVPEAQRQAYLIPDGHPNATGYQLIATNIVNLLQKEGILKRSTP